MKHIEVLFINGEDEHVEDVYLRNEDGVVLHEKPAHFNCRMTRPHESLFEIRHVSRLDSRIDEYLWYLRMIPYQHTNSTQVYSDSFGEIFLMATGFYMPDELTVFD